MEIRFHNTMTQKKETFAPLEPGVVRMYTCGPTVYDLAHIGNFRAYVFEDLLHRYLEYAGFRVVRVMNITDVDDKTIAGSAREGISLREYTDRYVATFLEDMETLRLRKPDFLPRATDHVPEMVAIITALMEKGLAYRKDDSIYFRIAGFPSYGKLSHLDPSGIKAGARVESDEYAKDDVRDFALWKDVKEGPVFWETALGKGRPGWHIECSAMAMKYLGETFDIHTGGVDNIFPHHENEIAQSEAATGKPFVRYWLHCVHLLVDGEKMSKSKGNFHTLRDLMKRGFAPTAVRYLLMATHYRDPLNFTEAGLTAAGNTVRNLNDFHRNLSFAKGTVRNDELGGRVREAEAAFGARLGDDLNISAALAAVFDLVRDANIAFGRGAFDAANVAEIRTFLEKADTVLGVLEKSGDTLPADIEALIREREAARKARNFKESDRLRDLLREKGWLVEDTPGGTRWKKA